VIFNKTRTLTSRTHYTTSDTYSRCYSMDNVWNLWTEVVNVTLLL